MDDHDGRRALVAALHEIAARRAAGTHGPSAPRAASCTNSCRSPCSRHRQRPQNERHANRRRTSGSTSARCRPFPLRGARRRARPRAARSRSSAPPATRCSRWRTAARTRAGRSATASCTAARSPVRCTTGSSISRTARRPAPTRAAPAVFPVKLENGRDLSRHERRRRAVARHRDLSTKPTIDKGIEMAYLVPSEFVTKMVDAGESKIFMSTRDTLIRAFMAGAILALAAAFAVTVTRADRLAAHRRDPVPGRLLHALPAGLRPADRRVRAVPARADRQAPGRDARRRAAQLGPGVLRQLRRRLHGRGADGDRLHLRLLDADPNAVGQCDRRHRREPHASATRNTARPAC